MLCKNILCISDIKSQRIIHYKCGGSLINQYHVLTSARCVYLSREPLRFDMFYIQKQTYYSQPTFFFDSLPLQIVWHMDGKSQTKILFLLTTMVARKCHYRNADDNALRAGTAYLSRLNVMWI